MNWDKRVDDAEPSWIGFVGIMLFAVTVFIVGSPILGVYQTGKIMRRGTQ